MNWPIWQCLSPKKQRELKKRFPSFKPPADTWNKRQDTAMEGIEEIGRLMQEPPKNVKRDDRW